MIEKFKTSLSKEVLDSDTNPRDVHVVNTRFISETGLIDIFLTLGPAPHDSYRQLANLLGTYPLPPVWSELCFSRKQLAFQYFSLGYHQSRWNYIDQKDVKQVRYRRKLNENIIKKIVTSFKSLHRFYRSINFAFRYMTTSRSTRFLSTLSGWTSIILTRRPTSHGAKRTSPIHWRWLTIWLRRFRIIEDSVKFTLQGRKLVTIVDPHVKKDSKYFLYKESKQKKLLVKAHDGTTFEGNCWPGDSVYIDFTNPKAREYWASRFAFDKVQIYETSDFEKIFSMSTQPKMSTSGMTWTNLLFSMDQK